jgi:ribosome-associated translation inhibitor RaiA
MSRLSQRAAAESVLVEVTGPLSSAERRYTIDKLHALAAYTRQPLRRVHVAVAVSGNPAANRPVRVSVGLDVNGRVVQARADGDSVHACIDAVRQRLYMRMIRERTRGVQAQWHSRWRGRWRGYGRSARRRQLL